MTFASATVANAAGTAVLAIDHRGNRWALAVDDPRLLGMQIAPYVSPPPTLEDYRRAVAAHVDATAQARNYDNGVSCASYVSSAVPQWAGEAAAFIAWRDAVWAAVFSALAAWQGGGPEPSIESLIAGLPAIEWPPAA